MPLRARQTSGNKTHCYLQGEKAPTCFPCLSLTATLFLSCRKSQRLVSELSPRWSTSLKRFYTMSKAYPNNFSTAVIHTVWKSETTLRSNLVRPKDAVEPATQDGVVYRTPCKCEGYRMVPSNLKVLAKFGLCSNCSQKLNECGSLAPARKFLASPCMLGFSLKFPIVQCKHNLHLENRNWSWKQQHARAMNVSGKCFLILLTFIETDRPELSPR